MIIFGWLFFSVAAGLFAHNYCNRDGVGWTVVAIFFSPLVAFVLLFVLKPGPDKPEANPTRGWKALRAGVPDNDNDVRPISPKPVAKAIVWDERGSAIAWGAVALLAVAMVIVKIAIGG
jgi:hypothetical protein